MVRRLCLAHSVMHDVRSTTPHAGAFLTCPVVQAAAAEHGVLDVVGICAQACAPCSDAEHRSECARAEEYGRGRVGG